MLGVLAALVCVLVAGLAAAGVLTPSAEAQAAGTKKAENVSYRVRLESERGLDLGELKDTDRYSKVSFSKGDTVVARLPEGTDYKLAGVYVLWDGIPGEWQLDTAHGSIACGQYGFIHEYVEFPEPVSELTLHIPAKTTVCDLIFYNEGVLPDSVQRWEPPYERADFLLFPSHGDDEHLFFGGIMPYYGGELGYKVQVAYMTNHAYTEMYRVHEQLDGLWTVGIRAYPCFGDFVDEYSKTLAAATEMYGAENVERWQVEMIRRFKPYVVVGHDFEGEYGHGAHRLNGTMLQKSVPDAADPNKFPESAELYGVWDTPKFYSHLYNRDNGVIIEWGEIKLSKFGGVSALEMAKRGYKCHESQSWTSFQVRTDGYGDCRQFGLYRSTVGEDVAKNDLLEHIVFEPEPTEAPTPEPTPEPTAVPTETPTPVPTENPTPLPPEATASGSAPLSSDAPETSGEPTGDNSAAASAPAATGTANNGSSDTHNTSAPGRDRSDNNGDRSIGWLIALLVLAVAALAGILIYMGRRRSAKR